ncbi:hypothetical protein OPV22_005518 [Ensete ventricosum]|uniref:Uncharacterized protein n=1 Tax=Ensete ventricosum TaxID=4639 RepID=A0AAV8RJ94_ENSVE|nr:hypothetical protein OPV22_005518 [Ensete ventricosum]
MTAPTDLLIPDLLLLTQLSVQFSVRIVKDKTRLLMVSEEDPQVPWNKWMQIEITDVSGLLISVTIYLLFNPRPSLPRSSRQHLEPGSISTNAVEEEERKKSVEGLNFPEAGRIDKEATGVCLEEVISSV